MSTAALNSPVINWHTCNHKFECHTLKAAYKHSYILPLTTSGGAWKRHERTHGCSENQRCVEGLERTGSTRAQFFRAAGALAAAHKGAQQANVVKMFKEHWPEVYPDIPVPLEEGLPVDFSNDPRFKPADRANSPAALPRPKVPAPTQVHQQPLPSASSGSDLAEELDKNGENPPDLAASLFTPPPLASLDLPPISPVLSPVSHDLPPVPEPQRPLTPFSPMSDGDEMIEYLRQHHFGIAIRPAHSGIEGGFFPGCEPKTKALRVVFVENPENRIPDSSHPLSFLTQTSLDKVVYDRLSKAIPDSVQEIPKKGKGKKKKEEGPEKIECYISSWLLLVVEMLDKPLLWKVTLTSWANFLQAVTIRDNLTWTLLWRETDLIIGGLDFEADFLNPSAAFGVNSVAAVKYLQGMATLRHVAIWPSPAESLLASQKVETNRILMSCASSLGLSHPLIVPVEDGDLDTVVQSIVCGEREGVLKRDFSGWSRHIITPHSKLHEATQMINDYRTELAAHWNSPGNLFPRPVWYLQPYLTHLIHLGEVRAFFVNGSYYYSVATTPQEYDPGNTVNTSATYKRPLSSFRYDPDNPTDPSSTGWLTLDGTLPPPNPALFYNEESFEMFSLKMLGKVILAEERISNEFSSLRIFARLDISVYRDATANGSGFRYVLSEVNRTLSTAVYSAYAEPIGTWDAFITHLAETLHLATTNKCLGFKAPRPPGL